MRCKVRSNEPFCRRSEIKLRQPAWLTANLAESTLEREPTHRSINSRKRCIVSREQPHPLLQRQQSALCSALRMQGPSSPWSPRHVCSGNRAQDPTCPHGRELINGQKCNGAEVSFSFVRKGHEYPCSAGVWPRHLQLPETQRAERIRGLFSLSTSLMYRTESLIRSGELRSTDNTRSLWMLKTKAGILANYVSLLYDFLNYTLLIPPISGYIFF